MKKEMMNMRLLLMENAKNVIDNGWHNLLIKNGMTFEECKSKVPKFYGV